MSPAPIHQFDAGWDREKWLPSCFTGCDLRNTQGLLSASLQGKSDGIAPAGC